MIKKLLGFIVLGFLCLLQTNSLAQIKINEVSPNNISTYPDNDGAFVDWIELYNTGSSPVNLFNYKISNDITNLLKWSFPNINMPAGGYLTIFASGKNRVDMVDHWESLVKEGDTWKYTIPSAALPVNWNATNFNDAAWLQGPGGIGYGDNDDSTVTPAGTVSVYMRRSFNVVDSTAIKSMILNMDYDDGFVAYLNGVEIARDNMPAGTPAYNTLASGEHEAVMYSGGLAPAFTITAPTFSALLKNGPNVLSIEVHNVSSTSSDLSSRPFLSVGIGNTSINYMPTPSWFIPPASGGIYLHTNFTLKASGGTVYLVNSSNSLIDQVTSPAMDPDYTYGRYPNGGASLSVLSPTPNASNSSATSYSGYLTDSVAYSLPAGFYAGAQTLSLSTKSGSTIRYTTDGSKPNASSPIYSGPISISSNQVIRAACYKPGYITDKFETNTYFIADGSTLPIFSISTHPNNFFNIDTGIYVMGNNASGAYPYFGANFWQDWKREVHIEYFDKTGVQKFEQDVDITIHGGYSRGQSMKSLRLIPGAKYGKSNISYPLFSEKNINSYQAVVLRNAGNDFNYSHLRDALNHRVLAPMGHVEYEAYEPVLVFINGAYWGVHTLRERDDVDYLNSNTGVSKSDIDFCELDGSILAGSNAEFLSMLDFVKNNDMTQAANYTSLQGMLDVQSCVDYFAAETYHTNWDWSHNNIRYWQPKGAGGKWRYIYHDTDFGEGLFDFNTATSNELNRFLTDTRSVHSPFVAKLLTNTQFKNYFVNRYADMINTIYQPSNFNGIFNGLRSQLNPEMSRHFAKWPDNSNSVSGWNTECNKVASFITDRPANARNHIQSQFGLVKQVNVTINVSPAGAGKIQISTITPGPLPWTGVYFDGVPVTMTVYSNDGYVFDHWLSNTLITTANTNKSITLNISSANETFTAYFNTTTLIPRLTFSEINYNSDSAHNAGNWVEIKNYGNATADLSGWVFKDSKDYDSFIFPAGTLLAAGQYLVICDDTAKFKLMHPGKPFIKGQFGFSLSNSGETIRLFKPDNDLYISCKYNNSSPWPILADGKGATLELLSPTGDLNDPANWFSGCLGGSPDGPYIACPCSSVNLGPDKVLCSSGGSVTLNSGITASPNRIFKWYLNGIKITGISTPSIIVSSVGTYDVVVDSLGCLQTDQIKVIPDLAFDLGPDVTLCNPPTVTLDSKLNGLSGVTFVWQKNGLTISGATASSLLVKTAGTYTLTVSAAGCTSKSDAVVVNSNIAAPIDAIRCGPGSITLSVAGPSTYNWYTVPTGGTSFLTGSSYTNPSISTTTTYYVGDAAYFNGTVGPASTSVVGGTIWNDQNWNPSNNYKMKFDVLQPLYIDAVTVFAVAPQNVTIRVLQPDKATVLYTKTVTLTTAGQNRIPLAFKFAAADVKNGYYMDLVGTTGALQYNGDGAATAYPYNSSTPGYMRIAAPDASWGTPTQWYFYLYNWEYASSPGGPCARTPVTATVGPAENPTSAISGSFNVCSGSTQTYSVSGPADAISYAWSVPAGTAITSSPANTSSITVTIGSTSGNISVIPTNSCGPGTATTQALTINSVLTPSVNISVTSGGNPSCAGSNVTFTAVPVNGGATPVYQWKKNSVAISGATSSTYSTTGLVSSDVISCTLTSSLACASTPTANSTGITMTVNPPVTPSLATSISSGSNPTCSGSSVSFTAVQTNGGTVPVYQWKNNGIAISGATGSVYTTTGIVNGDAITCTLTSNASCASPVTATSAPINMTVNPTVVPSVSISITAGTNPSCAGSPVTFTAAPVNGGISPSYQWIKNGTSIAGAVSSFYSVSGLLNNDIISCAMASNANCASPSLVTSSGISMIIDPVVSPAINISITSGSNPTCSGNSITFTASVTNGGASPAYQWKKNGSAIAGQTASAYTTTGLINGDLISCTLTSNAPCASSVSVTSASINMTVNNVVTPSVGISITGGANPSCSGNTVTFTAVPTNGGTAPAYQWLKNSANITGETNSVYTATGLTSGDVIACKITSNQVCANPLTAISTGITMTVNSVVVPSLAISITAGNNPTCSGSSVTFTAVPTNGGSLPAYQWKKNSLDISGATNSTYTSAGLANNDVISCSMTSNAACVNPVSVSSSGIAMTVITNVTPSVLISVSSGSNPSCSGSSVTFTAAATGGGTAPVYQWNKNSLTIVGATNSLYAATNLSNGDIITCTMTSNATCTSTSTVTSNSITMAINNAVTASVATSVTSGSNPSCSGKSVTFTAVPTGGGTSPSYQWNRNASPLAGETNSTYVTTGLANGDIITCTMTSNATCVTPSTVTSSGITMTVNATVVPAVTLAITTGSNPTCSGGSVTFTASGTNGGSAPGYQWNKNGSPLAGETNSSYTSSSFVTGDAITCTLNSNATCATPTSITSGATAMTVNSTVAPSVNISITNGTNPTCSGGSLTFTATPTNGGASPAYQWSKNGNPQAGQTASTYTLTGFTNGDIINCSMTSNLACASPATTVSNNITLTVSSTVVPSVTTSVTAGTNPACSGAAVTFTAVPANGGSSPVFQWNKNSTIISGETSSTYTTTGLANGDVITCTMTSGFACASPASATSSGITMTVNSSVIPSVSASVTSGSNPACSGSSVTFTAVPVNGGANPSYQWNKNSGPVVGATNATFTTTGLVNGDLITCTMTSNAICASPVSVTSGNISMIVNAVVTPSVGISITTGSNPSCSGASVTFTAVSANGGAAPSYQWNKNGIAVSGQTNTTYSSTTFADGDVITCTVVSNAACANPISVTSGNIIMSITGTLTPSVSISITAGGNPTCSGSSVTFTAVPANGGNAPAYQWKKNGGTITGETGSIYTTSGLVNNDVITCAMTSNLACASSSTATSSGIVMTVTNSMVPSVGISITSGSNPGCSGNAITFTALPQNGGNAPTYQWSNNSNLIAGATNSTYTTTSLVTGDIIKCTMVSNAACVSSSGVTSSGMTMTINNSVSSSVSISVTSGSNSGCSGSAVVFTAAPVNGGSTPAYQWNVNSQPVSGEINSIYNTSSLLNGDMVTCTMTSNANCASPVISTSNSITMNLSNVVVPSASISILTGSNSVCAGSNVTFTASVTNGGTSPVYQWRKNGTAITGEVNSSYTSASISNGDVIACFITSAAACATPSGVNSNLITMTVSAVPSGNAGPDQSLCDIYSATLQGSVSSGGSGVWTVISGGGTIASATNPASGITNLAVGNNVFRWTVSNGGCTGVFDEVTILVSQATSAADAGPDQNIGTHSTTLNGNIPSVGSGTWILVSGGGFISDPQQNNTPVGGLYTGANIYRWTITNGACPSSTDDVSINVGVAPSVGTISGPATVQQYQTYTYTVPASSNTDYQWTVPPGAVITGQGTNTVSITFGSAGGNVSVVASNPFGTGTGTLPVTVGQSPVIPGITGPDSVAANATGVVYSVPVNPDPTSTYNWSVPSGATITSGAGTNSITVNFGSTGGSVSVAEQNAYGSDNAGKTIAIGPPPVSPPITGPGTVNMNDTYTYTVPYAPGMQYNWQVPPGAIIVGGSNGSSITVHFGTNVSSGAVSVVETNAFGTATGTLPVVVKPTGIFTSGNTENLFEAYPNPFNDDITFKFKSPALEKISIKISDVRGVSFYSSINEYSTNEDIKLGRDLPVGVFVVQVSFSDKISVFKIVKVD
jgi:hypothetical protein